MSRTIESMSNNCDAGDSAAEGDGAEGGAGCPEVEEAAVMPSVSMVPRSDCQSSGFHSGARSLSKSSTSAAKACSARAGAPEDAP
eukprot:8879785-Pyramimonas_sp.AAC.1